MYTLRCIRAREDARVGVLQCLAGASGNDLVAALALARDTSVKVVEAVESWRASLWRPEPFLWKSQNYLKKMQTDLAVLGNPGYAKILGSINLSAQDLEVLVPRASASRPEDISTAGGLSRQHPYWAAGRSANAVDRVCARVHRAALLIADEGLVQASVPDTLPMLRWRVQGIETTARSVAGRTGDHTTRTTQGAKESSVKRVLEGKVGETGPKHPTIMEEKVEAGAAEVRACGEGDSRVALRVVKEPTGDGVKPTAQQSPQTSNQQTNQPCAQPTTREADVEKGVQNTQSAPPAGKPAASHVLHITAISLRLRSGDPTEIGVEAVVTFDHGATSCRTSVSAILSEEMHEWNDPVTMPLVSLEPLRVTLHEVGSEGTGRERMVGVAKLDVMRHHQVGSGFGGIPLHVDMGSHSQYRLSMTVGASCGEC